MTVLDIPAFKRSIEDFSSSDALLIEVTESEKGSQSEDDDSEDEEYGIKKTKRVDTSWSKAYELSAAEADGKAAGVFKYGGMALALLASVLISCTTLIVKYVYENYGTTAEDASFARWAGITLPSIPILIYYEWYKPKSKGEGSVFDSVWPLGEHWTAAVGLLFRGMFGCLTVMSRYSALQYLTIGDTSVISYSSPILVTILGHFLLSEKMGILPVLCAVMTLCGVVIITQPPMLTGKDSFDYAILPGIGFACGALVSNALMTLLTRKLRHVQFSLMLLVIGSTGMIQSYIVAVVHGPGLSLPKHPTELYLLLALSLFSFTGQMAVILALKVENAGPVALVRSSDVIFSFLFQFIFLGVTPTMFSAIGGSVVFFSIFLMAMRKYLDSVPPDNGLRKALVILLY